MNRKWIISLLLIVWPYTLWAQSDQAHIDSLLTQIDRVAASNFDEAINLTLSALSKDLIPSDKNRLGKKLGDLYMEVGQFELADSTYSAVIDWHKNAEDYLATLEIFSKRGRSLQFMGQLIEGLAHMDDAQSFIEANKDQLQERSLQIEVGAIYRITGILYAMQMGLDQNGQFNQASAESYFRKSYEIFSARQAHQLEGLALFNIGNVLSNEDSTIHYWQRALEVFDEHGLENNKFNVYQNLGILHLDKGEFRTALDYLLQSEALMPDNPNPFDLALQEVKMGKAYVGLRQFSRGINHLNEALKIGLEYGMVSIEGEAYEFLIGAYMEQNRFEDALDIYIKYDTLNRRFEKSETERIFRETEAKYKTREQQAQIALLEQEELLNQTRIKQQRLAIGVGLVLLLLTVLISYLLWKQAQSRKLLNEQLRKLDQARTRFLVNISHELRTPITLIHAPLQDAMETLERNDISRVRSDLKKISNNTRKLLRLTEEVLDISKLDEGVLTLEATPTRIREFMLRTFSAFESLAVRKKIHWKSTLNLSDEVVMLDKGKVEKILNNLLSNALKHTEEGGTIELKASIDSGQLFFSVTDTGKGIEADALTKIFDRYYQASEDDISAGGLGIGLAFVKELLDFMQGTIKATSTLGEGTSFDISLPIEFTEQAAVEELVPSDIETNGEQRPAMDLSRSEKPHILVVEDNLEMADFMQQLLADSYRVTLAHNGKEGLKRLQSAQFDLITADVMMPEMDGHAFVANLKEHSDWKHIPVIMITALSEEADKVKGLRLGVDDYIPKPFSAKELSARVENLLRNAISRKEEPREKEDELSNEEQFLESARQAVSSNLNNNDFSVTDLAEALHLSERQANRVLKRLTGLSALQFIRELRLLESYRLMETRKFATIAEVSFAVGFENNSYFTKLFTERFGKKPSEMWL